MGKPPNESKKIIISTLIAFFIAFSFLFSVNLLYTHVNTTDTLVQTPSVKFSNKTLVGNLQMDRGDALTLESVFFSKKFEPNEKRIFILGSSESKAVNTTQVQEYLLNHNSNYSVYNLAAAADLPESRFKNNSLDMIIASKPDIVVYGISYRDFMDPLPDIQSLNKPNTPLPDPSKFFAELYLQLKTSLNYNLEVLDNPKLVTLSVIKSEGRKFLGIKNPASGDNSDPETVIPYPHALFKTNLADRTTRSDQLLKNYFFVHGATFNGISDPNINSQIITFEKIIDKLQENNIKVIVFTTPKSKYYLNVMPSSEKEHFDSILKDISNKHHVKIYYSLWDKYKDMVIWNDPTHVAINHDGLVYGTDIAKIILNETRP